MDKGILDELIRYCDKVKSGLKPVANMPIQQRYIERIEEIVKSYGLLFYCESLSEGWKSVFIYKHAYLLEIIRNTPEKPKSIYDHWVLGKLFGYSDESIKDFINQL